MTERGTDGVSVRPAASLSGPVETTAALTSRVDSQIKRLESIIESLARELEHAKRKNRALAKERNHLQEELVHAKIAEAGRANAEVRWQTMLERSRDADRHKRALEAQNRELTRRCAVLERALLEAKEDGEAAQAEIACLEEQAAELRSIVDILLSRRSGQ